MAIINSGTKSISSFLKDDCYHIPKYQRNYAWTENQWEDLWMDLMQLYKEEKGTTHFFGQIVLHHDEVNRKKYIIDGQQRISTAVIFLDSFRKMSQQIYEQGKLDAKYEVEDLTTMYIGRTSDKRFEPRLFLNDEDHVFFTEYIQKEEKLSLNNQMINSLKKSEISIYQASVYFEQKLTDFLNQFTNLNIQYHEMKRILHLFLEGFLFMVIETQEMNEAFIIFETLNARGKDLAISDLLKNHVFRTANNQIADVKISWDWMIANLDGINPTKFIRHYWNAQYHFVREKDLYLNIRRTINSPDKVNELMFNLIRLSELYTSLNYPHKLCYFEEARLIEQNKEINQLGAKSYYPIIMALVIKGVSEVEISRVHEVIECLIVRNFTIAGKTANRSEKSFAGVAQNIAQGNLKTTDEIIQVLNSLIIGDEEFYNNFKLFEVKRSNTIRYLLRKIHNHTSDEMRIISDNQEVHIEHILPKSIGEADAWNLSKNEHHELLYRFGNVTMLGREYNCKAKNKAFKQKKELYQRSEIPMTKKLVNYNAWTHEEIETRQEELAKVALEVWKKN